MSRTIDGDSVTATDALLLEATTNQVVTSSASAYPTTITVPTMGQTTTITIPDPGVAATTVLLSDGVKSINGNTRFNGTLSSRVAAVDLQSAAGTFYATGSIDQIAIGENRDYLLNVPAPGQTTTVSFPDPGASTASVVLSKGATTMAGPLTLSTIPACLDVITNAAGVVAAAYPSTLSLPLATTTTVRFVLTPGAGLGLVYTVPTGYYAIITAQSQFNNTASTVTTGTFASPDAGVTTLLTGAQQTITTNSQVTVNNNNYIFLSGDSIMVNPGATGQTIIMMVLTFAADGPVQPIVCRNIQTSQTLYTCPTGMRATLMGGWSTLAFEGGVPRWWQNSGTAPTYTLYTTGGGLGSVPVARVVSSAGALSPGPTCGLYLDAGETFTMTASVAPNSAAHFWMAVTVLPATVFTSAQSSLTAAVRSEKETKLAAAKQEQVVTLLTAIKPTPKPRREKRESKRAIADDEWEPL